LLSANSGPFHTRIVENWLAYRFKLAYSREFFRVYGMLPFIRTRLPQIVVSHGVGVNSSPVLVSSPSSSRRKRSSIFRARILQTRFRPGGNVGGKKFQLVCEKDCKDLGRYTRNHLRKCYSFTLRGIFRDKPQFFLHPRSLR